MTIRTAYFFLLPAIALLSNTALGAEAQDTPTRGGVAGFLEGTGPGGALDAIPDSRLAPDSGASVSEEAVALKAIAEIGASSANGRAALKIARTTLHSDLTPIGEPDKDGRREIEWTSWLHSWTLSFSAPIDKSKETTDIIAVGGLPSDFSAKIGYSSFVGSMTTRPGELAVLTEQLKAACKNKSGGDAGKIKACDDANADDLAAKYLPESQLKFNDLTHNGYAYLYGLETSIGYNKFDFLDVTSASKMSATDTPWSAKGFVGFVPSSDAFLILAGVEYQDTFKAGKTGTLCPTAPAAPVLTCLTGALGSPSNSQKIITSLELKRQLPLDKTFPALGLKSLGVDAKLIYDVKNDVYGFDVPLTFAMDEKKNLIGGIHFGWQSDEHDFVAGLFLGSAFSLF